MFLLCRRLTGGFWPSLVGGYLFGFSSYMLGRTEGGHPNLTAVAGIPLGRSSFWLRSRESFARSSLGSESVPCSGSSCSSRPRSRSR